MRLICAITICCLPWLSLAGWNTNHWPTRVHPRYPYEWSSQVYSSLVERVAAADEETPGGTGIYVEPPYYRDQDLVTYTAETHRDLLASYKDDLKNLIPYYMDYTIDPTNAIDTNGVSVYLTVTQCLAAANAPTNYFDYTPYRFLSGLGGLTNHYAETGYLHGYTNEYTVAGGSYLPAGRTNWFTTDYGWQTMRDIVTNLYYLRAENGGNAYVTNAIAYKGTNATTAAYASAIAEASNDWQTVSTSSGGGDITGYTYAYNIDPLFDDTILEGDAVVYSRVGQIAYEPDYLASSGTVYTYAYTSNLTHGSAAVTYDDYSAIPSFYIGSFAITAATSIVSTEIGTTNIANFTPWADNPTTNSIENIRGYKAFSWMLRKHDFEFD